MKCSGTEMMCFSGCRTVRRMNEAGWGKLWYATNGKTAAKAIRYISVPTIDQTAGEYSLTKMWVVRQRSDGEERRGW
jgi:hypothetical protein